jgi:murein DD-endopeptidase MepM/ murein hydrolase activator NlpD
MRRRSLLTVTFVALLTVGWFVATTDPRGSALAADPEAELARTRDQLADALASKASLERLLADQRAQLTVLQQRSDDLTGQLNIAQAELDAVTAEYDRVNGLLTQVRGEVARIESELVALNARIDELDARLREVRTEITRRTAELQTREALLQDHLRSAYQQSQISLLEILLAADSLDEIATQVGYLLTVSDLDVALADEIRTIRSELELRRTTLREGRAALADARRVAHEEERALETRQAELAQLEARLAELKAAAEQKRAEQEALLNAALEAQGNVAAQVAANERAAQAAAQLAANLAAQAAAQQAAIEEARRRAAEEAARNRVSIYGFRWPQVGFEVTQEWGPTDFVLEPPYTYEGRYYPHFHAGIDTSVDCQAHVVAAGPGVVVAAGQPLFPFDSAYGVVIDHGDGIMTWYWHLAPIVKVGTGRILIGGEVIGYEGATGMATGCHLHFAVNDQGVWENPRNYLP